jgi:transposase
MLEMEDQFMMRKLYDEGLTITEISRETGYNRRTVRKYIQESDLKKYKRKKKRSSKLDPYKDFIDARLARYNLSAVRIMEEIEEQGYDGGYSTVKSYVKKVKRTTRRVPAEIRFETRPGIQMQVDWGELEYVIVDGLKKKLYCFNAVLGYSRMRYIEFTLDCGTETFIQCHMNSFQYFGGITKEILYDNTKNVVLKRALMSSKSTWNPLFEDFYRYYGFLPRLCKPGKEGAKTKGKVERVVGYAKNNFYLGRDYDSLNDLNNKARQWMEKVNSKIHGTTKEPPINRWPVEKLEPFDTKTPFQITRTEYRKISRDCFISYMGNHYSVPWQYAGLQAKLQIQNTKVKVSVNGNDICDHVVREGSGQVVRTNEHFEGLLKEIMTRNRAQHELRISRMKILAPEVEKRPLVEYDVFSGGVSRE